MKIFTGKITVSIGSRRAAVYEHGSVARRHIVHSVHGGKLFFDRNTVHRARALCDISCAAYRIRGLFLVNDGSGKRVLHSRIVLTVYIFVCPSVSVRGDMKRVFSVLEHIAALTELVVCRKIVGAEFHGEILALAYGKELALGEADERHLGLFEPHSRNTEFFRAVRSFEIEIGRAHV